MNNVKKLIADINNKVANCNERSNFTIKGVRNLSMSDLDTLVLYAETYAQYGSFSGLMSPLGSIKEVLDKYDICEKGW